MTAKFDPLPAAIEKRLMGRHVHFCATCLTPVKAAWVCERVGTGTRVVVLCHDYRVESVVPDSTVEDAPRVWHFVDSAGTPHESAATRKKRALQAEVDRLRAARRGES